MPRERFIEGETVVDPFYPDGYVSSDQDRQQIIAQKEKYAASVGSINFKFPLKSFKRGFFEGNQTRISLEDVEIFEPEFNEPKPISSEEIKDEDLDEEGQTSLF